MKAGLRALNRSKHVLKALLYCPMHVRFGTERWRTRVALRPIWQEVERARFLALRKILNETTDLIRRAVENLEGQNHKLT